MVACHLLINSLMGWSPAASSDATTGGYYHSPPAPPVAIIPVIRLDSQWHNPYRTLSISPVTNQISLTYNSTNWDTALYIIPWAPNVAPVFTRSLAITPPPPCDLSVQCCLEPVLCVYFNSCGMQMLSLTATFGLICTIFIFNFYISGPHIFSHMSITSIVTSPHPSF